MATTTAPRLKRRDRGRYRGVHYQCKLCPQNATIFGDPEARRSRLGAGWEAWLHAVLVHFTLQHRAAIDPNKPVNDYLAAMYF